MRYIIIGAGAVGGTIGARLLQSGHEVVLAARGEHRAALADRGLRFDTPAGAFTLQVPVVAAPGELSLRPGDVLIMAVKAQDAVAALDAWAWQQVTGGGVAAHTLPVFCAQNGVAGERLALRRFRRVYGMCVWLPATHLQPGVIQAQGTPRTGLLPVGCYPAGTDETAGQVAADLADSTFLAPVSADVMHYKYGKLVSNLANAVEAICGPAPASADRTVGASAGNGSAADGNAAAAAELRRRARQEGEAVLTAAGIGYMNPSELAELGGGQVRIEPVSGTRRSGGSSWQSLSRGTGSIEANFLNGEIVLLGRKHGVPAPVNELLQRLANQFAAERRAPGSVTPGEMAALMAAV
jgi:2-dehydropantoate 2-reductase